MDNPANSAVKFMHLQRLASAVQQLYGRPVLHIESASVSDNLGTTEIHHFDIEIFSVIHRDSPSKCFVWLDPLIPDGEHKGFVCIPQTPEVPTPEAAVQSWLASRE